jgi:hypothetical protein
MLAMESAKEQRMAVLFFSNSPKNIQNKSPAKSVIWIKNKTAEVIGVRRISV